MAHVFCAGLLPDERERPARFQDALFDFGERTEPLLVRSRFELCHGDEFLLQTLGANLTILDETIGPAFYKLIELPMIIEKAHDKVVSHQQGSGADNATKHAVIVTDDGVLDSIGEREQDDQVKRVELDEFALSRKPQADYQESLYDHGTENFLREREPQYEHILPDVVHCRIAS